MKVVAKDPSDGIRRSNGHRWSRSFRLWCLEVALQQELLDFRFPPTLDQNVPGQTVDGNIGALGSIRIARLESQKLCQVTPQRVQIAFGLLELRLLLGTAGLGDQVHGELVGGCATDEVGEVGELQIGRRRFRRGVFFQGLGLTSELYQEGSGLLCGHGRREVSTRVLGVDQARRGR